MKNGILIGMALGAITATVVYQKSENNKMFKRGKKAIVKKLEDILD